MIKRIYEDYEDGYRILIDRLWPRGISKERARVDLWLKEIAPSDNLRKWFSHDPKKWQGFKSRYADELKDKRALLQELKSLEKKKKSITLLYSAKDNIHNNAVALKEIMETVR